MKRSVPSKFQGLLGHVETLLAKHREDAYTLRLRQAITGMLDRGNVYAFNHALERLPSDAPIVEIGAFCGLSTNVLAHLKRVNGLQNDIITCDRWDYSWKGLAEDPIGPKAPVTGREWGPHIQETFMRHLSFFSRDDLPYPVKAWSDEFFEAWSKDEKRTDVFGRQVQLGGPISFCYIDGRHDYEFVKRDFENADRFLVQGGWILFDDSSRFGGSPGVKRFMRELRSTRTFGPRYEVVLKNPHHLVRKR